MGAKKAPSTSTKQQNNSAGVVKKVTTAKQREIDIKTLKEKEKLNLTSADAKKLVSDIKVVASTSNSNKKTSTKQIVNNVKVISTNKEAIKKSQNMTTGVVKNNKSRDNSKDNSDKNNIAKKQQQIASPVKTTTSTTLNNIKVNKTLNGEHEKSNENKSNHIIKDNKINVKNEDVKSNTNLNCIEQNKKDTEKSITNLLSIKSTCENAMTSKVKLNKKDGDKSSKLSASTITNLKKVNNKSEEKNSKKNADKTKSKVLKKETLNNEKDNKLKISNELKNLGIEMTTSNSSFDSIQEGLSSDLKTSICEMVKLKKARHCPNSANNTLQQTKCSTQSTANYVTDMYVKSQERVETKDSQEKAVKKNEPKSKTLEKSTLNVQLKSKEKEEKKCDDIEKSKDENTHTDSLQKSGEKKIIDESKNIETTNKFNDSENMKPVKRKYIKKKKTENESENKFIDDETKESDGTRNSEKPSENKSNLLNISSTKFIDIEKKSNIESKEEIKDDKALETEKNNKNKDVKNESNEKPIAKIQKQTNKSSESLNVSTPKKIKSLENVSRKVNSISINRSTENVSKEIKRKYTKKGNSTTQQYNQSNSVDNSSNNQSINVDLNNKKTEIVKNLNTNSQKEKSQNAFEKPTKDTATNIKDNITKENQQTVKNNESKKVDTKKSSDSVNKSHPNKNNNAKVKVEGKKSTVNQKKEKATSSKKKKHDIEEKDPLRISTSESESSSENSDSDMELSDDIFKKPLKPKSQQANRNKNVKQIEVIKQTRVASLNAIAKVHCLYENEARSHYDSAFFKNTKKPTTIICKVSSEDEDDESDSKETECTQKRSLRTAPGLRAIGKHWEMDSMSSDIDSDSDISQKAVKGTKKSKSMTKTSSLKAQEAKQRSKQGSKLNSKMKNQIRKTFKQSPKTIKASDHLQKDSDKDTERKKQKVSPVSKKPAAVAKKSNGSIKRKKAKDEDKNSEKNVVTKKRMASLNASAILAASYEIENYAAKHDSSTTETSEESDNEEEDEKEVIEPPTLKKEKKDVKMESTEETRPKSTTNLVKIDTDVTITGVYVNSALVSSQETICKTLKYRTAYSVTEECVVSRPPTQEPPKSYTPLSALTNMRPPGGQIQTDQCMISPSEQYQPQIPQQPLQPQMYDPHMAPYQYQYPPPPPSHPMPSTSSAFYPPQPVHRDPMGYYQPAGPLLSPHLLPPPPSIEGDQSQQALSGNGTGDNVDPDVMITDAHQYHSASCPCPMQSCQSKNVHTGTGPTKAKGPVSACNGMAETLPKIASHSNGSVQPTISCKVENILSPNLVIKPENDKLNEGTVNQNRSKSHELYENIIHSHEPTMTYSMNTKLLDTPDLSPSPSRGSIGIQQIPIVQHDTAVQPKDSNLNSDNTILSHRKQARIGKSMERDRQLQQQQAVPTGYHNHHHHHHHHHHHINQTMINNDASTVVDLPQFKQEYPVKKERDVKKEKDCDEITMTNFSHSSAANIKVERPENENHREASSGILKTTTNNNRNETPPIVQNEISSENDIVTVNLVNESSDECGIDYSIKRKHIYSDDVIELSDNSTLDPPTMPVKRRKLLEKPINTPKKSPPNSYKSLIKQSNSTPTTSASNETETVSEITITPAVTTSLLITPSEGATATTLIPSNINRILNKSTIKRRNILKSKSTFKTMRFTAKAKRRALLKKKQQLLQQRKKAMIINLKSQQERTSAKMTSSINENDEIIESNNNHSTSTNNCSISETTQLLEDDNDNSSSAMTIEEEKSLDICEQASNEMSENNEDKSMDGSSEYSGKSNIDLTIDRVAKGYFSESEIFSSLSKHRKTKSQKRFEARLLVLCAKEKKKRNKEKVQNDNGNNSGGKDKSLNVPEKGKDKSKKKNTKVNKAIPQQTENTTDVVVIKSPAQSTIIEAKEIQPNNKNNNINNDTCNKKTSLKKPKKTKAKEPKEVDNKEPIKERKKTIAPKKKAKEAPKNSTEKESLKVNTEETPLSQSTLKKKLKVAAPKKGCTTKKAKTNNENDKVIIEPSTNENDVDANDDKTIESKDEASTTTLISSTPTTVKTNIPVVIDETDVANNNNECFENNNKKQQEPLTLYKTPGFGWTTALVKASRRGKKPKYTNRKKVKLTLPNDIIIPKSTSIPRWSNGWVWEGEPYQALVFLNSDDPPVPRTCYDSMRHEECGDKIKPRDCVLLRAGGKRNELPYVAKVAQLWENPEDGEMMMSLFWYYRPEHTEQGRQNADAIDEVFASRHKDHNSVACIEDKCYVITYNEYCRYRKMLRSIEENIEESISLVPKLHADRRSVPPPNTSPELVMFCRRVYDFRGKRLMDDKKKK
ncbi:hypothetical protein ACKWTF_007489 [Chironomus riparius]